MTGKTHLAAGALVGTLAMTMALGHSLPLQPEGVIRAVTLPVMAVSGVAGALFPDIDWQTSKIGSTVKPISRIINILFGHRTLFHSPILYILVYVFIMQRWPNAYWAIMPFVLGVASHLLLDMMNYKGISLFYPYQKRFHIISLKSNGWAEKWIRNGMLIACLPVVALFISRLTKVVVL